MAVLDYEQLVNSKMNIGVAYSGGIDQQAWLQLEVPVGSTVQQAIEQSGILKRFPSIDLNKQKVGIYGKIVKLDTVLQESDRVEIYRQITADPKKIKPINGSDDDDDDDDD